jgi:hypothetical protein
MKNDDSVSTSGQNIFHLVLERRIPCQRPPDEIRVAGWEPRPKSGLHIEAAKALARHHYGVVVASWVPFSAWPVGAVAPRNAVKI